jgi:hypothetical protein
MHSTFPRDRQAAIVLAAVTGEALPRRFCGRPSDRCLRVAVELEFGEQVFCRG